jgi:hypothetical protein
MPWFRRMAGIIWLEAGDFDGAARLIAEAVEP